MKASHLLFVLVVPALTLTQSGCARKPATDLFSEEEAEQLGYTEGEWFIPPSKQLRRDGPIIVVLEPSVEMTDKGPRILFSGYLDLSVRFDENQAAVDIDSLEVIARKYGFKKNLTDLVSPYLSDDGLSVRNISVRQGKYKIDLSIRDIAGRESAETYLVQVN